LGKKEIAKDYNSTAGIYDMRYMEEQLLKISFILKRVMVHDGETVVDAGCGTGMLLSCLGNGFHIGIDTSVEMLKEAKKRHSGAEFVLGDVEALPIRGESCDKVFCVSVLQLVEDPQKGLDEIMRVLKRGSAFGISLLNKASFAKGIGGRIRGAEAQVYESESMRDVFVMGYKNS